MTIRPVVTVLEGRFRVLGLEPIAERAEIRVVDAGELQAALPGTHALLLWDFFSDAVSGIYGDAQDLEWIHIAATGVDKLLVPELVDSSIVVTNANGIFDRPIAEYVLACVAAFLKDMPLSIEFQGRREWLTRQSRNLFGTSVLVVGAGGIGRATARLLRATGMDVTVMGRTERADAEFGTVLSSNQLAERVGGFGVVVVAAPLTRATHELVSAEVIAAMAPGAFVVNVGRGKTVDQGALTDALISGRIGGAALDTFLVEPLPADDPLWRLPNVFVSPHMSSRTEGWLEALSAQFCSNFDSWMSGQPMVGVVDKQLGFVT